jgi:hypothetical protein
MPPRAIVLVLLALLAAAGCSCSSLPPPEYFDETPVGSNSWTPIPAEPAWVKAPPRRESYVRYVSDGKSNLRGIAATGDHPMGGPDAERLVRERLTPVVGARDAGAAAALAKSRITMVSRACREELLTHDEVPGNTLCTAWALWEFPIDDVVAAVPPEKRDAARAALRTP